jgi:nicotinamide-nucleotide amidase
VTAEVLISALKSRRLKIATAESCTGGLVASAITDIAGSSRVFDRGFITYSDAAKTDMLGVPADLIARHGAVSEAVARAMAEGALRKSAASIAVSTTGVAGPGGGTTAKPVGLVHFACATPTQTIHLEMRYGDVGRATVRKAAVDQALQLVLLAL